MGLIINISILVVLVFIAVCNVIFTKKISIRNQKSCSKKDDKIYQYLLKKIVNFDLELLDEKLIVAHNVGVINDPQFYRLLKRYKDTVFYLYNHGYLDSETYIDLISRL